MNYKAIKRIKNIDKKGVYLTCPRDQEVIISIRINKIYISILENYLSLTIIKYISTNSIVIPFIIIILGI